MKAFKVPTVRSYKNTGQYPLRLRGNYVVTKAQTLSIYLLHSRYAFCIGIKPEDDRNIP